MRRLGMVVATAAALLSACGGSNGGEAGRDAGSEPLAESLEQGVGGGGAGQGASAAVLGVPSVGPTVIKTARLDVMVERDGFAAAMNDATAVAAGHGGFVVSSSRLGDDAGRGSVTIRVPSDRFEAALADLRALGDVQREDVEGRDVGQEFVDLEARLRNLEAQEAVMLRLFDRAASVADTIRIQNELSAVQLDIEQLEGRLRYLRDQTAFGTISFGLTEEGVAAPGRLSEAWRRAGDALVATAAAVVLALGYVVPLGLIALVVWFGFRRVSRWVGQPEL